MDVKHITTTSDKLSDLPISNGQIIYLSDRNASYYDMSNSRRLLSSMRLVSALPSTALVQEDVLYGVVNSAGKVDASIWDSSASTYRMLTGYVATTTALGLVKPDGTTITINSNGVISATQVTSLPSSSITYNNSTSGLTATDAQAAIDEVKVIASNASTAIAAASTAIADILQRLAAVEAVADVALTQED